MGPARACDHWHSVLPRAVDPHGGSPEFLIGFLIADEGSPEFGSVGPVYEAIVALFASAGLQQGLILGEQPAVGAWRHERRVLDVHDQHGAWATAGAIGHSHLMLEAVVKYDRSPALPAPSRRTHTQFALL